MYVQNKLKSKFAHYSNVRLQNGMSGKEIAEKMLADNGIHDVKVISVAGQLTDHYNPMDKTVNLSDVVYNQRNAAAAAGLISAGYSSSVWLRLCQLTLAPRFKRSVTSYAVKSLNK